MPPHARLALLLTALALLAAPADASVRLLPTPGADVLRVTSTVGQLVHGGGGGRIDGGGGVDTIFGGRVRNLIYGGPGDDILQNGIRWNTVYGGPGNDTITGRGDGRGPNWYYGGSGDDAIAPRSKGRAIVDCGPDRDTVTIGYNREIRWRADCEKVTTRYKRR